MIAPVPAQPEKFIDGVRQRLAIQVLWQAALFFLPPLFALYYMIFFLYRFAWLDADGVMAAGAALLVAASALAAVLSRSRAPSRRAAARLLDDKAEAEDRFVTLATIDLSTASPALLFRLKDEAAALQTKIDLKKNFPFRVRQSFLDSSIGSLIAIVLFHLLLELAPLFKSNARESEDLAVLGARLSRFAGLEKVADSLKALPTQLQDTSRSIEEKRAVIEELLNRITDQSAGGRQGAGNGEDLLRQAANQLEKGQNGNGAGGGRQRSTQESGRGNGAANGGTAEQQKGLNIPLPSPDGPASSITGSSTESSAPGGAELKGQDEGGQRGERKDAQENKAIGLERAPKEGMESERSKGQSNKNSAGKTPERFLRPGAAGQAGLKDARFVTVQLPENESGLQTGAPGRDGKRKKTAGADLPAGNLPLNRPDRPDAGAERQMLPLEYRGMIR